MTAPRHCPTTTWSEVEIRRVRARLRDVVLAAEYALQRIERGTVDAAGAIERAAALADLLATGYRRGTPCPCSECQSARFVAEATASLADRGAA